MQVPIANYGVTALGPAPGGPPRGHVNSLPKHLQQDIEIQQLCDKYQSQLAELNACHSLLMVDQERLAGMLAPYVNAFGQLVMEKPDPDVLLFKQGLDLRLAEFEEDCKRIQKTEKELQDKIDEATSDYEQAVHGIAMSADSRVFKRLREQQRLIDLQQQEIDQIRYEKELLQEETKRLRDMAAQGGVDQRLKRQQKDDMMPLPRLHSAYEAKQMAGPLPGNRDEVIFGNRGYR